MQEVRVQSSVRGVKIPPVEGPKDQNRTNRSNIVPDSKKTLKMVHVKKNLLKNKWKLMEEYLQREGKHLKDAQHQ